MASDAHGSRSVVSEQGRIERATSERVVERARNVIPGGAQTGLRAQAHEPSPVAFERAGGTTLETVEGTQFTDYHLAFGPIVLGHGHEAVDTAAHDAIDRGVLFGAGTTELEVEVAERLVDLFPGIEACKFCNSGTEATYHAIRLARAHTGRETVIKFEGCYHGWHDYVDQNVYPPAEHAGEPYPESEGMLGAALDSTLVLPFNDPERLAETLEARDDVACVILEPIPHSVGCLLPTEEFLTTLREVTAEQGVPLIFDEVISGVRHSIHGAQGIFDVTPDLTCLAKAMGNGYPVAAVGGREEILAQAGGDNTSGVVISGTYSGHPIGLAATRETLRVVEEEGVTDHLVDLGERYRDGLRDLLADHRIEGRVVGYRSIFGPQFGVTGEPRSYDDVLGLDEERFKRYAAGMRERGQFFTPNPYKRHHLSAAHGDDQLTEYLDAADEVLAGL